jgi:hypothetical protein
MKQEIYSNRPKGKNCSRDTEEHFSLSSKYSHSPSLPPPSIGVVPGW